MLNFVCNCHLSENLVSTQLMIKVRFSVLQSSHKMLRHEMCEWLTIDLLLLALSEQIETFKWRSFLCPDHAHAPWV